jgi:hypothetical protein
MPSIIEYVKSKDVGEEWVCQCAWPDQRERRYERRMGPLILAVYTGYKTVPSVTIGEYHKKSSGSRSVDGGLGEHHGFSQLDEAKAWAEMRGEQYLRTGQPYPDVPRSEEG